MIGLPGEMHGKLDGMGFTREINVTTDKQGRTVAVRVDQVEEGSDPRIVVEIEPIATGVLDSWTWLSAAEARELAAALVEAADEVA